MHRLGRLIHDRLSDDLLDLLRPYLVELYARTGEVVTLGVLDGAEMVILETARGLRHGGMATPADRTPAHCSAIGKLLLAQHADLSSMRTVGAELTACTTHSITDWSRLAAELRRIRLRGVAISRQEHVIGVVDIALPVIGRAGPVAGIALSHPVEVRVTPMAHAAHRQIVLAASAAIRTLGQPPGPGDRPGRPARDL